MFSDTNLGLMNTEQRRLTRFRQHCSSDFGHLQESTRGTHQLFDPSLQDHPGVMELEVVVGDAWLGSYERLEGYNSTTVLDMIQ